MVQIKQRGQWQDFTQVLSDKIGSLGTLRHAAEVLQLSATTLSYVARGREPDLLTFSLLLEGLNIEIEGVRVL